LNLEEFSTVKGGEVVKVYEVCSVFLANGTLTYFDREDA
jgi:hypothetical protein